ncbi:MAG: hypothetical protein RBT59_09625 [Arcobacteraceae bacterium]|jgi:hypothetical protein|nr:hypothetical protein [Arcobacteraceae bacterium]
MKRLLFGISIFSITFFSGCSSKYPITYASEPSGATLICEGTNWGYTPKTLYYDFDTKTKESGTARTNLCTAKWISGATKNYSQIWDLKKFPNGVMQTLQRPDGDGYKDDAEFALKVESLGYQKKQADATKSASDDAYWHNINQNFNMQQQNIQLQQLNNNLMYKRYGY